MTTVSDLEQENVAPNNRAKKISAEIAQEILHAVANIKYGSIEIIIHDSKVVQIERREKIRLNQSGSNRNALKSIIY